MPSVLYLIGSVHMDPEGPTRLRKLLGGLKPDIVSVESDESRVRAVEEAEAKFRDDPERMFRNGQKFFPEANPETLRAYIKNADFEYFTARDYAMQNGNAVHLSDRIEAARLESLFMPGGPAYEEVRRCLMMTPQELARDIDRYYRIVPTLFLSPSALSELASRDEFTEGELRKLPGRVVHVAGMMHLYGSYNNLYERTTDMKSVRMTLGEADVL